jgi:hypothetical protein
MRISISWLGRQIACCLVTLLVASLAEAATTPLPEPQAAGAAVAGQAQTQADARGTSEVAADGSQPAQLPDSPGAAQAADQSQQTAASPVAAANQQSTGNQSTGNQSTGNQSSGQPPVGTAAAPYVQPGGVAASRPAGAAIAPAKQKRSRSFAIKVGLLVGAAVAIGVVTAVSLSSPSRPH